MRRGRGLLALLLAALLSAAVPGPQQAGATALDARIQQQQRELNNVQSRLRQKKTQFGDAQARVGSIGDQLATANRNVAAVRATLDRIAMQVDATDKQRAWNRVQLGAAQQTLARHTAALQRRLIDAYEFGDLGYLAVLLDAKSFQDFVERWSDVRYLIKANEATIRERRAAAERVAAIRARLQIDEASLRDARAAADQQRLALEGLALQRRNLLAVAEQRRTAAASEVAQLDDMSESAEAALEALVREKQAEEEARRAALRRAAQLAGESLPPEPGAPGELMWPVSGPITSPFGMRIHTVYGRPILHAGIDIAAPQGTTIAAAAAGRVIVAGYQGDCGNMVALDDYGGLSTIYCHMSQIFVEVGQEVQRGQAIGAVGMTGDATGPHLHFQVMENGHPVDPMSFLR